MMNNVYKLHRLLIKTGQHNDSPSIRRLLLSCLAAAPESLSYARSLFSYIPCPDTFAYNILIRAHVPSSPSHALHIFSSMLQGCVLPDNFTFPFVLKASARLQMDLHLHSLIFKLGLDSNNFVQNGLINMYGSIGSVQLALKVFDEIYERDLVSWSSMISCLVNNGFPYEALALFRQMQLEKNFIPDEVTMLSVISAISSLGELELGQWVNVFIRRHEFRITVSLGTALIDMFSKCGCIDESIRVFEEMPVRNVLTWTVLINGLAVHGYSREALKVFHNMKISGFRPDNITLSGILVACSHGGLIEEGQKIFESIRNEHGMEPSLEHYSCMVDILGRAGLLCEAYKFVERMPMKPNSIVWRPLLAACVNRNDLILAEKVKAKINALDPYHDGDYVLLSNVYGGVGKWIEKASMRSLMKNKRIRKRPGYSMINVDQMTHEFYSGDNSHSQYEEIVKFLSSIVGKLKNEGYYPSTSNVLHDIEEEEKEENLSYHSEKLAVAFALLSLKDKRTIRIMKNLRTCYDCHCFMKQVSDKFDREIIVRDRNRFHHFCKGSCSCQDYW